MTTSSVLNPSTPPAVVLMNKGVPVKVYKVEQVGDGTWDRLLDESSGSPEPEYEWRHVRLNALALAEIEDRYGSIAGWEVMLSQRPFMVVVATLSIIWEMPRERAGKMLIESGLDGYTTALGAAFVIANGGEVDAVVRVLEAGVKSSTQARKTATAAIIAQVNRDEARRDAAIKREAESSPAESSTTPGLSGSPNGVEPAAASMSSGD